MGKSDIYMKRWLSDKRRFSDLINGSMFQGKQVFSADHLKIENSEQSLVLRRPDGRDIAVQRYRDIMMVADDGTRIVVLACENQEDIHYAMPVRGMLYDALSYVDQISEIKKMRRKKKELGGSAEFLSGLKKDDRLFPVITVVFYYGEEKWDGAQNLHSLLGIDEKEYKILKRYVPNYRINLIDPRQLDQTTCFQTDLQMIFGMLKYREDKDCLQQYVQSNQEYFSNIDEDSFNAVRVLLGSQRYLHKVKQTSGGIDMCKALEDLYQDGVEQGIKVLILDYREEGYDKEKILLKLQNRFSLTREKAEEYFKRY